MADERKPKTSARAPKRVAKANKLSTTTKVAGAKTRKLQAESKAQGTKTKKTSTRKVAAPAAKRASKSTNPKAKTKAPAARARKATARKGKRAESRIGEPVLDPIGDVISGEARTYLGDADLLAREERTAYREETEAEAVNGTLETAPELTAAAEFAANATGIGGEEQEAGSEEGSEPQAPARLERLQKILSRAGIASRRRAEEMIVAGRVMVNGQVVTQLGSKADPAHDHIRVDGKLIHGDERHRYFVLNKPRGYVTTVSDPEGRPTVMQFFAKMHERLYPVGRLDYQSEGLLLMTNDGELANLLTKAGSGVEKTYLVKVAGQPSEEQLERLRGGVAIEKGYPGSTRVRTAPARIRKVREGENPWYEVVLTEGRNRELRKMFAAIGHFAEKIRRVGYGPLALDVEPGRLRELTADEVNALRLTAEGKMKPQRVNVDRMLPREAGLAAEKQKRFADRRRREGGWRGRAGQRQFGRPQGRVDRTRRDERTQGARSEKPRWQREERGPKKDRKRREFGGERREFRGGPQRGRGEGRFEGAQGERGERRFGGAQRRPYKSRGEQPQFEGGDRPQFEQGGERKRRFGGSKSFGRGAKFGGKPGGFGKFQTDPTLGAKTEARRGWGTRRGRKFGGSRRGAARGGWKRGPAS